MAKMLIIGGGGMVGQKLAARLAAAGPGGHPPDRLVLHDRAFASAAGGCGERVTGNLVDSETPEFLASQRFDVIFHLAAIVSGEAEKDFEKGWQVNLFSVWRLLEALRSQHEASAGAYRPRFVFASSTGAFGPPFDGPVGDLRICEPRSSYGSQKVCAEMLVSDFSRKGYLDGMSIRLPTICVRPGKPNAAASSFFSNIIREPLNGRPAVLPVSRDLRHMLASPRSAAGYFIHASRLDTNSLDGRRTLNMPSLTCSVGEQIEALNRVAGSGAVGLIKDEPDPFVESIVSTWPAQFNAERAAELGFTSEDSFDEIVRIYIEDDLPHDAAH